nr:unnamed protein product [Spirometra erinaceieuropaei]
MWRQGEVPQDFKDATILHLYKRKGNRQVCDNHRGISLLNIAGKIFARILLNRLNNHLEQGLLPESQCGFRRHRGTTDMIFATRQLQEKCQEMRTHLYSTHTHTTVRPSISTMTTVCPTDCIVGAGTVTYAGVYSSASVTAVFFVVPSTDRQTTTDYHTGAASIGRYLEISVTYQTFRTQLSEQKSKR